MLHVSRRLSKLIPVRALSLTAHYPETFLKYTESTTGYGAIIYTDDVVLTTWGRFIDTIRY